MNRSPAFQFYPDKWKSHTRRLSDSGYRVFHELICWMWESSPDYCSVEASPEAVACAIAMPVECVRNALAEINNAFAPLLQCDNGRWVSNGLKKEATKQKLRREKAADSANARWEHANASKNNANASSKQCFPIPIPIPSLIPSLNVGKLAVASPAKTEAKAELTDAEWLESLKNNIAYEGLDIRVQFAKMQVWCSTNKKQPNRRRFINWLNRCDKPMAATTPKPQRGYILDAK